LELMALRMHAMERIEKNFESFNAANPEHPIEYLDFEEFQAAMQEPHHVPAAAIEELQLALFEAEHAGESQEELEIRRAIIESMSIAPATAACDTTGTRDLKERQERSPMVRLTSTDTRKLVVKRMEKIFDESEALYCDLGLENEWIKGKLRMRSKVFRLTEEKEACEKRGKRLAQEVERLTQEVETLRNIPNATSPVNTAPEEKTLRRIKDHVQNRRECLLPLSDLTSELDDSVLSGQIRKQIQIMLQNEVREEVERYNPSEDRLSNMRKHMAKHNCTQVGNITTLEELASTLDDSDLSEKIRDKIREMKS